MSAGEVFGWIATYLSIPVFMSPTIDFIEVLKGTLSYEKTPIFLILTTYFNCLTWYYYGCLNINQNIKMCNLIGIISSLIFSIIYIAYEIKKLFTDAILNALIIFTGTWASKRQLTINYAEFTILGNICIGTTLIQLSYPSFLIYRVIKEKNYKLIPLVTTIFFLLSGICWIIYGLIENYYYIIFANLLNVFVSVAQIIVYKNYQNKYHIIGQFNEISNKGIDSSGDDDNSKIIDYVDDKINVESREEKEKIKPNLVNITNKKKVIKTSV